MPKLLQIADLVKLPIVGGRRAISKAMKKFAPKMPDIVRIEKFASGYTVYKIAESDVQKFCERAGLRMRPVAGGPKDENWITPKEFSKYDIAGSAAYICRILGKVKDQMPLAVQYRVNDEGRAVICANKNRLDEIVANTCLHKCESELDKMVYKSEWKNLSILLEHYIIGGRCKISKALLALQDDMPNAIRMFSYGTRKSLCVNINHLAEVCERAGLKRKDPNAPTKYQDVDNKTPEWLSAYDLQGKYIVGMRKPIKLLLEKYQPAMPNAIQKRAGSRGYVVLCLHRDYIRPFCEMAGLIPGNEYETKTDDWFSAATMPVVGNDSRIAVLLKKMQPEMPYAIQLKKCGSNITFCLNKKYINEFCERTGIKLQDPSLKNKPADYLTSVELYKLNIGCSFSQIKKLLQIYAPKHKSTVKYFRGANGKNSLCIHKQDVANFLLESGAIQNIEKMAETKGYCNGR